MFRPNAQNLAHDLARFVDEVFHGPGVVVGRDSERLRVIRNPGRGAVGDCALLCSSPRERTSRGRERLPLLLRRELGNLPNPVEVFNPRGQQLSEVPEVQQLCGLILECVDPDARIQNSITNFPGAAANVFNRWRQEAQRYINSNPPAPGSVGQRNTLDAFVRSWQQRSPQGGGSWPREVALIELLYELVTWILPFQEDQPFGIFLEAITRTITQMAPFAYDSTVHRDPPWAEASVRAILWNVLEPLAAGAIDIDEDLIEQLPRDRLQIMSIHQAKGLEFPLVIVDVASDFTMNHHMQAYARYPTGGSTQTLEDELRPFSPLGQPTRAARDRAFDDLTRHYFVAFSRPQDVLMLVGIGDPGNGPLPRIRNVAAGYTRDEQRRWDDLPRLVYI
jgi:DNA helicase II / ATP-dependent DNA helicase PcrA